MKNKDEDIEILKNPHKMELTQLIRTFKREGIENFVTVRKENLENVLKELEELRKYDIRKIELKNGMIEKAPSFTKREIELMNLGIALYCNN